MKLNNNKSLKYIKLSSNQKFDMTKNRKKKVFSNIFTYKFFNR